MPEDIHNIYVSSYLTKLRKKVDRWCSLGLKGKYPYGFTFYLENDDEENKDIDKLELRFRTEEKIQ